MRRISAADAKTQLRHYSALCTFSHTLLQNEIIDQEILLQFALTMILEFVQGSSGRLLLLGRNGRIQQSFCLPESLDTELRDHCCDALRLQQPILRAGLDEASPRSVLCIPLVGKSEPFGILCLQRDRGLGPFGRDHLDLAMAFADQLAHSVYAERLLREKYESEHLAALGRMASRVVHDMNNPLAVVQGYTDMLLNGNHDRDTRQELLRRMMGQFDQMRQMLVDVLAYAGSRQRRSAHEVDLAVLLRELVDGWLRTPETRGVKLRFLGGGPMCVQADSLSLSRAFRNLVLNGVEAAAPGGSVLVSLFPEGRDLAVDIADTGPGIPLTIQETLFQPFVTHGKSQGTGLGLAIAKNLIEEHGGALSFTTGSDGTCFHVRLPLVR